MSGIGGDKGSMSEMCDNEERRMLAENTSYAEDGHSTSEAS